MSHIDLAPICLFVYDRPIHTERTLKSLAKANLADSSKLYIFADGPKVDAGKSDLVRIEQVRQIITDASGFREVAVKYSNTNLGLGKSIIQGVSEVIEKEGRVIVLEDDLLVHPDFLIYMNHYLHACEDIKQIWHISGFQRDSWLQFLLPKIYFTRFMNCSGWATWKDRWDHFIMDINAIDHYLAYGDNLRRFDFNILDHSKQLELNRTGLKTWAIFWYATIAINKGLCLNPQFSYVQNIGNEGSGTNNVVKDSELTSNYILSFKPIPVKVKEHCLGDWYIRDAYGKRSRKRFNTLRIAAFRLFSCLPFFGQTRYLA